MKKTVVIWSSPNTDGLTAAAKDSFIRGLKNRGMEVEEIHLNRCAVEHCRACGNGWGLCAKEGKCVIADDFAQVYEKLREADGIALITAVYWADLTEQFKALIDRLRRCECAHNHTLKDKRIFLAACAGGTGQGALECLQHLETSIKHMGMRAYDRLPVIRFNKDYMLPALEKAGEQYARCLVEGFDMRY